MQEKMTFKDVNVYKKNKVHRTREAKLKTLNHFKIERENI